MEELLALLLGGIGEVCCQALAALGVDGMAALAGFMSGREDSRHQQGWRTFFWVLLPIGIILTFLVLIAWLFR